MVSHARMTCGDFGGAREPGKAGALGEPAAAAAAVRAAEMGVRLKALPGVGRFVGVCLRRLLRGRRGVIEGYKPRGGVWGA